MRNIIKKTVSFGIACALSLIIISLFVLVYGYTGVHIENDSGATDYKWMPNQYKATMTEGFAWMKFDSEGFNNTNGILPVDVLIMGSSHMEAVNLPSEDNTGAILNQMLPDMNVYNIGVSGHTIYQCANNLRNAISEYSSAVYVIIETDTVYLENDRMIAVLDGTLKHIPSYTSGIVFLIQRYCPAIKSIYKHLEDWRSAESRGGEAASVEMTTDEAILDRFLSKISSDADGRKIIIVYHPLTNIDSNGELIADPSGADLFRKCCFNNGIAFVDMTNDFQYLYDTRHILSHGFTNTAVGVGHLNSYGHKAIAERLAEMIMEDQ